MNIAILGAGNGGLAMAGQLSLQGHTVNLFDKFEEAILPLKESRRIEVKGVISGSAALNRVTSHIGEAIEYCSFIIVITPAFAHRDIAENISAYLKDGQIVLLHPGRTGGAIEFRHILKKRNVSKKVTVAETQTLLYASRRTGSTEVTIYGIKKKVSIAALPSIETENVVHVINQALPYFIPARNILFTSLHNIGAIFHPTPTLLNIGRIETENHDFDYYHQGITPSIAKILDRIDQERIAVARAYKVDVPSAQEWLYEAYEVQGASLWESIQRNKTYSGILAPNSVNVRYISEDVPMSLVPISSLGKVAGIPTPSIDAVIELTSALHDVDYRKEGRNLDALGLDQTMESILNIVGESNQNILGKREDKQGDCITVK